MSKNHMLTFKTYDRMIPAQDTLFKGGYGGFGNLIALPLQPKPREQGHSMFIDENFITYPDQWNYLYNIKKYTQAEIETFIRQLTPSGELGDLHRDTDDEKPWESKKREPKLTKFDFPDIVEIVRANMLYIKKTDVSSPALNTLKRLAAFHNPEFYRKQAMRLPTHSYPRVISCSEETEQYLCLPRGLEDEVDELLKVNSVNVKFIDETNAGRKIDVVFNGKLRDEQHQSADALLAYNNGVLHAATAFGKTVIGAHLISDCKVNALRLWISGSYGMGASICLVTATPRKV